MHRYFEEVRDIRLNVYQEEQIANGLSSCTKIVMFYEKVHEKESDNELTFMKNKTSSK